MRHCCCCAGYKKGRDYYRHVLNIRGQIFKHYYDDKDHYGAQRELDSGKLEYPGIVFLLMFLNDCE